MKEHSKFYPRRFDELPINTIFRFQPGLDFKLCKKLSEAEMLFGKAPIPASIYETVYVLMEDL